LALKASKEADKQDFLRQKAENNAEKPQDGDFFAKVFDNRKNPAKDRRARQDKVVDFMTTRFLTNNKDPFASAADLAKNRLNSADPVQEARAVEIREKEAQKKQQTISLKSEQAQQIFMRK
jgi:hypothetical protein